MKMLMKFCRQKFCSLLSALGVQRNQYAVCLYLCMLHDFNFYCRQFFHHITIVSSWDRKLHANFFVLPLTFGTRLQTVTLYVLTQGLKQLVQCIIFKNFGRW